MAEAQAAGTPVLAFQRGGALDIVRTSKTECPTGMFFGEQSPEAIKDVVERFIVQQSFYPAGVQRKRKAVFHRKLLL